MSNPEIPIVATTAGVVGQQATIPQTAGSLMPVALDRISKGSMSRRTRRRRNAPHREVARSIRLHPTKGPQYVVGKAMALSSIGGPEAVVDLKPSVKLAFARPSPPYHPTAQEALGTVEKSFIHR